MGGKNAYEFPEIISIIRGNRLFKHLFRPNKQEQHRQQNKGKIEHFGLEVFLVEQHCAEKERHNHATPSYHTDNTYHCFVMTQRVEIDEVGCGQEDGNEDDAPIPMKLCGITTVRIPQHQQHDAHHEKLIDVVPRLNCHFV